MSEPTLTGLDPLRTIDGGRLWLRGSDLPLPAVPDETCTVGGRPARVLFAAPDRLAVEVPTGLDGGRTEVKVPWLPGATLFVEVGRVLATGLHQVDSPVIDAQGRVYVTYSGSRGQQAPVSIFRVPPGGAREPFVTGIVNATSMAFDPGGRLYVSSRFDGAVSRVDEHGQYQVVASDLGLACGLAFAPDGTLFIGDRSGTLFQMSADRTIETLATLPASVAAFHLAFGPDGWLYVSGPTLSSHDPIYRVSRQGAIERLAVTFGRPQGLAFDADGRLHVAEALAGASGIYRVDDNSRKTLVVSGPRVIGLAFAADGQMVVATSDTVYGFG